MNYELFLCNDCFKVRSPIDWNRAYEGESDGAPNPYIPCPKCGSVKLKNAPITRMTIAKFLFARPTLWSTFFKENVVGAIRG